MPAWEPAHAGPGSDAARQIAQTAQDSRLCRWAQRRPECLVAFRAKTGRFPLSPIERAVFGADFVRASTTSCFVIVRTTIAQIETKFYWIST